MSEISFLELTQHPPYTASLIYPSYAPVKSSASITKFKLLALISSKFDELLDRETNNSGSARFFDPDQEYNSKRNTLLRPEFYSHSCPINFRRIFKYILSLYTIYKHLVMHESKIDSKVFPSLNNIHQFYKIFSN